MSEWRIRPAQVSDLAEVARLEGLCFHDPWSLESLYAELLPDAMRLPLVAEREGRLGGFIMAWRVADELHILNIAADPEVRRRGLGTTLLRAVAEMGVAGGQIRVTLEVRDSNLGARAFYRRHGFREVGVRRGYYQDNGEDAVIMTASSEDVLGA